MERRYAVLRDNLKEPAVGSRGEHLYSSLAYMIAGTMAERVTGESWESLMQKRLFAPLGITTAGFGPPNTRDQADQPWAHHRDANGRWVPTQEDTPLQVGPAGTAYMSIEDWAKFIALWFRNKDPAILDRKILDGLIVPGPGSYAAGWYVAPSRRLNGETVISHAGATGLRTGILDGGVTTELWIYPSRGVAYLVFINFLGGDLDPRNLRRAILVDLVDEQPPSTFAREDGDAPARDFSPTWEQMLTADRDATLAAAADATMALPAFGGVVQSTNRDAAGVTTDSIRTAFDGETLTVRIARLDADAISLSTTDDTVSVVTWDAEPGKQSRGWYLGSTSDGGSSLVAVGIEWNNDDPSDYTAVGYWMHVDGNLVGGDISGAEMGAFVDGPEFALANPPVMPVQGTARYAGSANGLYAHDWSASSSYPPGSLSAGEWSATAELTADFASNTIQGCIGCGSPMIMGGTFVNGDTGQHRQFVGDRQPFALHLGATSFDSAGGFRDSSVTVSYGNSPLSGSRGAWGGRFSNILDSEGNPRLVAGTVGAYASGSAGETTFIGNYFAEKQ